MFLLDPRLERDTFQVLSLPLCNLLLMNNALYPWLILVPRREAVTEIHHLGHEDRRQLWEESHRLSCWMTDYFTFDKLNIAALGNMVSQLHLHHVGRTKDDPAWPAPVWGHGARVEYRAEQVETLARAIREGMRLDA